MRETGVFMPRPEASFTYRAAALIIKDDKLLVAKSSDYPCYYTVGGAVEINETSGEAAVREVYEETGYALEVDRLAFVQERFMRVNGLKHHEVVFFYLIICTPDMNIAENSFTDQAPKETLHWLPLSELREVNLVPEFLKVKSLSDITSLEHIVTKEY